MARRVRFTKEKRMRPNFFVFCEGETEIAYIQYLRSKYRVPIQIIPRKSDSNISCRYIVYHSIAYSCQFGKGQNSKGPGKREP